MKKDKKTNIKRKYVTKLPWSRSIMEIENSIKAWNKAHRMLKTGD